MDELKKSIDLIPISDENIKEKNFTLKDLWMVKDDNNKIHGPFDTYSLREYSHRYDYLFEHCKLYNLKDEKWFEMFSNNIFQRRKPKLISGQNTNLEHDFYVLINGQKSGPYTTEQMQHMLDTGEILPSTQISLDLCASWIKLYEHHAFDRRTKKTNEQLPYRPESKILEEINHKKEKLFKKNKDEQDALIDLAFIGHHKDKDNATRTFKVDSENIIQEIESKPIITKKLLAYCFSSLAIIGLISHFAFQLANDSETSIPEAYTESKSINNTDRSVQNRVPASTVKSPIAEKPRQQRKFNNTRNEELPKRYIPKKSKPTSYRRKIPRQNVEKLDINDPEVQEEITRQLSGEYDLDGEPIDEEMMDGSRMQEDEEPLDANYDEYPEYNEEKRIEHLEETPYN